jgi:hypothetical protein
MRLTFVADEGGFDANEDSLACGVSGDGHYVTLQRDAEEASEDWGIYLEYDDQLHGEYNCVGRCRIGPETLSIDLAHPLVSLPGVTGFDVALQLTSEQLHEVRKGLGRVFRGYLNLLLESDDSAAAESELP